MVSTLSAAPSNWPQQKLTQSTDKNNFVSEKTCVNCHSKAVKAWTGSHHQQAPCKLLIKQRY
ncbi:MAG: hypothetical protein KAH08_07115 [Methylococcales bacterium]|nr:hypothetical protein [Methylococcales bacterium]